MVNMEKKSLFYPIHLKVPGVNTSEFTLTIKFHGLIPEKELSICHKLWYSNPYIFKT